MPFEYSRWPHSPVQFGNRIMSELSFTIDRSQKTELSQADQRRLGASDVLVQRGVVTSDRSLECINVQADAPCNPDSSDRAPTLGKRLTSGFRGGPPRGPPFQPNPASSKAGSLLANCHSPRAFVRRSHIKPANLTTNDSPGGQPPR